MKSSDAPTSSVYTDTPLVATIQKNVIQTARLSTPYGKSHEQLQFGPYTSNLWRWNEKVTRTICLWTADWDRTNLPMRAQ